MHKKQYRARIFPAYSILLCACFRFFYAVATKLSAEPAASDSIHYGMGAVRGRVLPDVHAGVGHSRRFPGRVRSR